MKLIGEFAKEVTGECGQQRKSACGKIKHNLKLSERVYKCETCGLEIDRDFNASLNLANYALA